MDVRFIFNDQSVEEETNQETFMQIKLLKGEKGEGAEDIPTKLSELENDVGFITDYTETDPTVPSYVKNIKQEDINTWNNKSDFSGNYNDLRNKPIIPSKTSDLSNDSGFIDNSVNNLTNYTLATNTGTTIELNINSSTYVMTLNLKNSAGRVISTGSIDLPLETMVVNASYNNVNKTIILTLQNGNTISFSVADLVSGLQTEITSTNKLSSDLVDDTNKTNKFVTTAEKTNWNSKGTYNKPSGGIPKNDLSNEVKTSLEKADNALPSSKMITLTEAQYEALQTKDADTYYHIIEE